jgi:ketosteroid isomerase-like protein
MRKIQIGAPLKLVAVGVLSATMTTSAAFAPSASLAADQPSDAGQAAIRTALTKWTNDFNTGNIREVCDLFSSDLRYDYRGFPERAYNDMCDGLRRSLTDRTKRYSYSLAIKEILVSGDLAVVRLTWTLTITRPGGQPEVSREHGIDVFQRQRDQSWKIIRFIAYDEAG